MENSVSSAIEKIKLQELNTDAKLREKRELELTVATLKKNIRDTLAFIENSKQNQEDLAKKNNKLRSQLELIKIRRDALLSQIEVSGKELKELINKADEDISKVWKLRSSMISATHEVTDNYDIFALLTKPVPAPTGNKVPIEIDRDIENKLKEVMRRKEIALAERERLLNEPETGAEFIRDRLSRNYRKSNFSTYNSVRTLLCSGLKDTVDIKMQKRDIHKMYQSEKHNVVMYILHLQCPACLVASWSKKKFKTL